MTEAPQRDAPTRDSTAPTVAAQLTPVGRGAIAVVTIRGPRAVEWVSRCFAAHSGRPLADAPLGRIVLGLWRPAAEAVSLDPARVDAEKTVGPQETGEDLVVCRVAEDTVEVHCHGGQAAVARVLESLRYCGCRILTGDAVAGEAAIIATSLSGWQREVGSTARAAWAALPQATTVRTATILLDQAQGALDAAFQRIDAWTAAATDTATDTAARGAARNDASSGQTAAAKGLSEIESVLRYASLGAHLLRPWRVVLLGPPNVGKSSLINAIVGFERAVVHAEAGTTRDVVTARTALEGWPVEFYDTAGLRREAEVLEAEGIRRALAELEAADLLLLVRDITDPDRPLDVTLPPRWQRPCLQVWNKVDRLGAARCDAPASEASREATAEGYCVSARTGQGIDELLAAIVTALVPEVPDAGASVPWTEEQRARLEQARATLLANSGG
jgi:tRNA modification GTPase